METTSIGAKIVALRKKKGCTQADLGAYLNISYQAVSKWERGESFPDFITMSRIAQFFNVPITYFEEGGEAETAVTEQPAAVANMDNTILGVCKSCGKLIRAGEEWRKTPFIQCKVCHERVEQRLKQEADDMRKKREYEEAVQRDWMEYKKKKGYWIGGIVGVALFILFLIGSTNFWVKLAYGVVFGGLGFLFCTQYVWGGIVRKCAACGGAIIGTPGVIFSLDLDGLIFLAAVKIGFAILRLIIFAITSLFMIFIAICISPFSFVPTLLRVHKGVDVDDD